MTMSEPQAGESPAAPGQQECAVDGDRRCTTHGRFYKECWPDWTPDQSAAAPVSVEVTDADRATAEHIAVDLPGVDFDDNGQSWAEHVSFLAQALANQRAATDDGLRGRVEAVAAFCDEAAVSMAPGRAAVYADIVRRLRAALGA